MTDDIEWGEWQPGIPDAILKRDYQFQHVGGASQWRVPKAPPAPVVETITIGAGLWEIRDGVWHIGTWERPEDNRAVVTFNVVDGEPDLSTLTIRVAE